MKGFIALLVILAILLCGCSVKKKMSEVTRVEREATEQKDVKTETKETAATTATTTREGVATGKTTTEGKHIKYAPDKPIDPATGKPPVESETIFKTTHETTAEGKEITTVDKEVTKDVFTQDSTRTEATEQTDAKTETKLKRSFPLWGYLCIMAAVVAVVIWLLWWLKRRK